MHQKKGFYCTAKLFSLLLSVFEIFMVSCVPNTRIIPLQYNDVNLKDLPKDSIIRTRKLNLPVYHIKPQDQLSINVATLTPDDYNFLKELNPSGQGGGAATGGAMGMMNFGYFVSNDGFVTLPVVGNVPVAGLTLEEAEDKLKGILSPLLKEPVVRIRMLNYRFTFLGEVNGQVTAPTPRISLVEAITLAGAFTEFSDRANIKIIRQKDDQVDIFYVNLLQEEFISSPNFWVQQNDIIIVPPLRQQTARKYLFQNIGLGISLFTLVLTSISLLTR